MITISPKRLDHAGCKLFWFRAPHCVIVSPNPYMEAEYGWYTQREYDNVWTRVCHLQRHYYIVPRETRGADMHTYVAVPAKLADEHILESRRERPVRGQLRGAG